MHSGTEEIADAVARVEADLVAERLGRIEDLEALVALVSGGIAAIRADVGRLDARSRAVGAARRGSQDASGEAQAAPATAEPPGGRRAYRSLFARTEPGAERDVGTGRAVRLS